MLEGSTATQWDVGTLEKRADIDLRKFSKKQRVLPPEATTPCTSTS